MERHTVRASKREDEKENELNRPRVHFKGRRTNGTAIVYTHRCIATDRRLEIKTSRTSKQHSTETKKKVKRIKRESYTFLSFRTNREIVAELRESSDSRLTHQNWAWWWHPTSAPNELKQNEGNGELMVDFMGFVFDWILLDSSSTLHVLPINADIK